jgi:hypothetical protein
MEFTYNASAVAAGGVIEQSDGNVLIVPSLAPIALSPTGGGGSTSVTGYVSEVVSFSSAYTSVFGREVSTNVFTTTTHVNITNLQVLDVLNIAQLTATVTSTRTVNPDPAKDDDDHAFDLDATYDGVRVKRPGEMKWCEVGPKIDLSMKRVKRYKHLQELLDATTTGEFTAKDGSILMPYAAPKKLHERFGASDPTDLRKHLVAMRPVLGTFVEEIQDGIPSVAPIDRRQHKLFIPGVGTVRFGELMLKPGRRRVNLLRISFGPPNPGELMPLPPSPVIRLEGTAEADSLSGSSFSGGSLTIASVEGNGSPLWP